MKILALDLGKFKSVACVYDVATASHEFVTVSKRTLSAQGIISAGQTPRRVYRPSGGRGPTQLAWLM